MKVKEIPKHISDSITVGEMLNLKCIFILVEELTENPFKNKMLHLIEDRTEELMNMDV